MFRQGAAMKGLIVIPAFNEENSLPSVIARLRACEYPEEILVVDDGSADATRGIARGLGVKCVSHPVNLGYVRALQTGIRYALERGHDYLVFIDADGQHDPREIALLKGRGLAEDGPDIVIGSRFVEAGQYAPLGRRAGMLLFSWLTGFLTRTRILDTTSGFKLMKRQAMRLVREQIYGDFHSEMIIYSLAAGLRVEEVSIHVTEREHGTSMYSWLASLAYPIKTLLAISILWPRARRERALPAA
jgi:glycosyltransferase involved in cell wall biosynthesis